mmetsp:Transcript_43880/g.112112  ORF Transcript_43880/g.112112 Transcript_43880/m.112112 type:complete len:225 (-) Transcript_43880:49-723(-)
MPGAHLDLGRVGVFSDLRVQGGLVQRPALVSAGSLHKRRDVGLRDVEAAEPHDHRLAHLAPVLVLRVAPLEPRHPAGEHLVGGGVELGPNGGQLAVEERVGDVLQLAGEADLAHQRAPEVAQADAHAHDQDVPALDLLQQHHLRGAWDGDLLLEHWQVKGLRQPPLDVLCHARDELLARDAAAGATGARLQVHQVAPDLLGRVGVVRDVRVGVQPKRLRRLHQR